MQPVAVLALADLVLSRHGAIDSHRYAHRGRSKPRRPQSSAVASEGAQDQNSVPAGELQTTEEAVASP